LDRIESRKQQRIKKLYRDAVECARAEGARGKEIRRIAMDYLSVLKLNGSCVAPMGASNG
jgi:hypothetical protein